MFIYQAKICVYNKKKQFWKGAWESSACLSQWRAMELLNQKFENDNWWQDYYGENPQGHDDYLVEGTTNEIWLEMI